MCEAKGGSDLARGQISTCKNVLRTITFSLGRVFFGNSSPMSWPQSVSVARFRLHMHIHKLQPQTCGWSSHLFPRQCCHFQRCSPAVPLSIKGKLEEEECHWFWPRLVNIKHFKAWVTLKELSVLAALHSYAWSGIFSLALTHVHTWKHTKPSW